MTQDDHALAVVREAIWRASEGWTERQLRAYLKMFDDGAIIRALGRLVADGAVRRSGGREPEYTWRPDYGGPHLPSGGRT